MLPVLVVESVDEDLLAEMSAPLAEELTAAPADSLAVAVEEMPEVSEAEEALPAGRLVMVW